MAKCYDHLGNIFNSKKEMCEYYGVCKTTFKSRIESGWSLEDALTGKEVKKYYDHLGNEFESIAQMCEYHKINQATFASRIKSGYSLECALETKNKIKREKIIDHLGNHYNTLGDMLKHYNLTMDVYYLRKAKGEMTLEEILTTPMRQRKCKDHLGNEYDTCTQMCKQYNISACKFLSRIKAGWSLEDALTIGCNKVYDTFGNEFKSLEEMGKYYGIKGSNFRHRVSRRFPLAEALGIEGKGLDAAIRNNEDINIYINSIKKAYNGLDGKIYYTCIDKDTGEELLLNADEILMYKQSDYRTAVEQLIKRRKEKLSC